MYSTGQFKHFQYQVFQWNLVIHRMHTQFTSAIWNSKFSPTSHQCLQLLHKHKKNSIKHTGLSVSLSKSDLIHSFLFLWASMAKQCNNDHKIHTKNLFFQGYNKPFTSENNIQSTFHYEITSRQLFPNQTTGTSTCVSLVLTSAKENPPPLHPPLFFLGDKSIIWDIPSSAAIFFKCRSFFLH